MTDVVQKLWGFCHTLRHDGISYTEYVEQLTYLLFLKMADEKGHDLSKIEVEEAGEDGKKRRRKVDCSWPALRALSGTDVLDRYVDTLRALGKQPGTLGDIYAGAQSRFTKPVSLKTLIGRIDETEWTTLGVDVKAEAYEGLLEKAASEGKKGAGQMFTPRVLIRAIVRCMRPDPRGRTRFTICDPACGTGGFLVAAYEWLIAPVSEGGAGGIAVKREEVDRIRSSTYFGQDIDATPRRLALMNLYLHQIEPQIKLGDTIYDPPDRTRWVDVVLTNPPFGTRGANQAPEREDFTVATSNKQLNFVQHVLTILKPGGRAAIVLPDNCLFADQAGEVFKILVEDCDLHTVLRLPRGTFTPYSQGVKANVVFFTKGAPTETTWIYDARTNVPGITKKDRPLTPEHFAEFEECFGLDPNGRAKRKEADSPAGKGYLGGDRWCKFAIAEVKAQSFKLDGFKWLKDEDLEDSGEMPEPEELATDAIAELRAAVEDLSAVLLALENGNGSEAGK
ncbi:MAG: class I SAM-dependent DNA methyltransferase [Candidatus Bipolaricaulota bacterium]